MDFAILLSQAKFHMKLSGGREKEIFSLDDIVNEKYVVIITVMDTEQAFKIRETLTAKGMEVASIEQILYGREKKQDIVSRNRQYIAEYHKTAMNEYFENAESSEFLMLFWDKDSIFRQLFSRLSLEKVVELACGRGRHVPQYISDAQEITLVDILEKNILFCRERFNMESKIHYYVNNGHDLSALETERYTALFTYDAMVHFEMFDIFEYLKETYRILARGGKALFHHSNNTADYRITFSTAQSGRNYMSKQLFAYLADRAGFAVLEQHIIDWFGVKDLDCVTLVEKR